MSATRARGALVGLLALLLCLAAYAVPSTRGALNGKVTNTTDTAATGIYATCDTAATGIGSAYFIHPFDETSGSTASDASGNGRTGTYRNGGTVASGQPVCPDDGGRAIQLNGTSQVVNNNTRQANPQTFSVQLWFRTTTNGYGRGGRLIGFGNNTGATISSAYDRHLYMSNTGRVVFGVFPGSIQELVSPTALNNAAWHHAVATLAPAGSENPGMRLYIDGVLVRERATVTSAQDYDGYWRIGWDNLDTWTNEPTSYYFAGRIAYGAVFTSALTPVQVATLYQAGRP